MAFGVAMSFSPGCDYGITKENAENSVDFLAASLPSCPFTNAIDTKSAGWNRLVQRWFSAQRVKDNNNSQLWFFMADHALG